MTERIAPVPESPLIQLRRTAAQKTSALGHVLGPWENDGEVACRAVCTKCGRAVYARAEGSLVGIAGRACSERCDS